MDSMKIIDTHTHIYLNDFDADRDQVLWAAKDSGIEAILLPNVDATTIGLLLDLCDAEPGFAFPMMGLHPTSVDQSYAWQLKKIETALSQRTYYGIGEIGIDLYWDQSRLKEQKIVFEEQLRWSIDLHLPVAIHTRNAFSEIFDSLYKIGADSLRGVFHCFSGT
jgi:TatD DNase family protein